MHHVLFRRAGDVLLAALIALAASGEQAVAVQFDVTTAADAGPGSLRQALLDAASAAGADDVVVQPGLDTITLSSELAWSAVGRQNPVTIQGNGVRVDFNGASRGFVDLSGQGLTITDMTITGVAGSAVGDAAPVLSEGGDMVLERCTISGNTVTTTRGTARSADVAGAVLSEGGSVTIRNCTISGNAATGPGDGSGGVLSEGGRLDVSDSTISANTVTAGGDAGGGLASEGGDVSVRGATIERNLATAGVGGRADAAGGLLSEGGSVTVDASTFAGNSAVTSRGEVGNIAAGGLLSSGGRLDVSDSTISANTVTTGGDAGGGLASEGGDVSVRGATVECNRATGGADAAGGLLSKRSSGGSVTVDASTFAGNSAVTSGGEVANSILSVGPAPVVTGTTITEDQSRCIGAIESYFLSKRVKARFNVARPEKSRLVAAGFFDTGPAAVDLTQAATLDVGGLAFQAPGLVRSGRSFKLVANGVSFVITPNRSGSSRAKFRLKTTGDLTGKILPDGPLALRFSQGAVAGRGEVKLSRGTYALGRIRGALVAPSVYLVRSKATIKGPGKDALAFVAGLATTGVTPAAASDLGVRFGDAFGATIPAASFTSRGDKYVFKGASGGLTSVVADYRRETITVRAKGIDLGSFVEGTQSVRVSIALGSDRRDVLLRMVKKRDALRY